MMILISMILGSVIGYLVGRQARSRLNVGQFVVGLGVAGLLAVAVDFSAFVLLKVSVLTFISLLDCLIAPFIFGCIGFAVQRFLRR